MTRLKHGSALAQQGGATDVIAKPVSECKEDVLKALDGQLPRIVNDATGHPAVFAEALQLAARFGRVVVLGDTGSPSGQHLTADVVTRGLTIVGAHDGHDDAQWNKPDDFPDVFPTRPDRQIFTKRTEYPFLSSRSRGSGV